MSNLLTPEELSALRQDLDELIGVSRIDGVENEADTTVRITRVSDADKGELNEDTLKYDTPSPVLIYEGPFVLGPVLYRRDRQEDAGGTAQRIRQYRGLGPYDMPRVEIKDQLEVLTSNDPLMAGLKITVTDFIYEDDLSGRRITFVDTSESFSDADCD